MAFDPIDVGALKRRKREQGSRLDAMLARERASGLDKRDGRRPGSAKMTQFNVRVAIEDKAFIAELAAERKITVVEIVAEAIDLLRDKYPRSQG